MIFVKCKSCGETVGKIGVFSKDDYSNYCNECYESKFWKNPIKKPPEIGQRVAFILDDGNETYETGLFVNETCTATKLDEPEFRSWSLYRPEYYKKQDVKAWAPMPEWEGEK
jgi:hypothetical protein